MNIEHVNSIWDKYGNQAWAKCIPQIREMLGGILTNDEIPEEQKLPIIRAASLAAARAYRLGFKIGSCVGEREAAEASKVKIITDLRDLRN